MADVVTTIEQLIIDRLSSAISSSEYKVERFPERPSEYRLYHSLGAILVAYPGSRYTDSADSLNVRTMQWVVTVLVKGLQTHHAAYPLLGRVIDLLDGWDVPDAHTMRIQYDKFIREEAGVWQYDLLFHLEKPHIAGNTCLATTTS